MSTVAAIAGGAAASLLALWHAWLRLLRPRVVIWHVRRRYGRIAAWLIATAGLHRRR